MTIDRAYTPTVGPWAERKYDYLRHYLSIFSTAMRTKWSTRVYVDLFAAAGRAKIRGTNRVVDSSALIALNVRHRFDRYVFCDRSPRCIRALSERVRAFTDVDIQIVRGDCNERVAQIVEFLPPATDRATIGCCMVDPFGLKSLRFETVVKIAAGRRMDFLVLIPSFMSAHRNQEFLKRETTLLDLFLGSGAWRHRWEAIEPSLRAPSFASFVVDEFGRSMSSLGYVASQPRDAALVDARGRKLYHLALYSKNRLGPDFWAKARLSTERQSGLFDRS